MLQRAALTLLLVATCALCLTLVIDLSDLPKHSPAQGIVATSGAAAAPPT